VLEIQTLLLAATTATALPVAATAATPTSPITTIPGGSRTLN